MSFLDKLEFLMNAKDIKNIKVLSEQSGIPYMTIKNFYSKGTDNIKLTTLRKLCDFFCVSLDYMALDEITDSSYGIDGDLIVQENKESSSMKSEGCKITTSFSMSEQTHIENYRLLDNHGKETVDAVLSIEVVRMKNIERERIEQARIRCASEKRISTLASVDEDEPNTLEMRVYNQKASAGLGNYLYDNGDGDYEVLEFDSDEVPHGADFGIRITGNSMEPDIEDSDIVWVREQVQVENGQIGIFIVNGDSLCKKLHIDHSKRRVELVSLNQEYRRIVINEDDDFRTIGKVLL